jgi:ABC transporter substrate binding protein
MAAFGRAQQPSMPVVGFLSSGLSESYIPMVAAFRQGLKEVGYVEGQNVAIEFRWAENDLNRLSMLAADLIHRETAVVATGGGYAPTRAIKGATATIPIVFVSAGDPVAAGLVTSINRPGGNITGVNFFTSELGAKRLEVLREMVPKAKTIAMLFDPASSGGEAGPWLTSRLQSEQVGSDPLLRGPSPSERSRRRSRHLCMSARTLSWSSLLRYSRADAIRSWRSLPAMQSPLATHYASSP